jgi:predicted ABC-type ATPase
MRVNQRVKRGGHDVPEPTIRRRYYRGLFNLFKHYLALADTWIIFDNSTDSPDIIAFYENERLSIRNTGLFEQVKRYAEGA